jgi:ABC-type multidrug transport system permease subunit
VASQMAVLILDQDEWRHRWHTICGWDAEMACAAVTYTLPSTLIIPSLAYSYGKGTVNNGVFWVGVPESTVEQTRRQNTK